MPAYPRALRDVLSIAGQIASHGRWEETMAWRKPRYKEVCCGFEITKYVPAEL
jgi:coenzyme PQQ precursor peptide PqqA